MSNVESVKRLLGAGVDAIDEAPVERVFTRVHNVNVGALEQQIKIARATFELIGKAVAGAAQDLTLSQTQIRKGEELFTRAAVGSENPSVISAMDMIRTVGAECGEMQGIVGQMRVSAKKIAEALFIALSETGELETLMGQVIQHQDFTQEAYRQGVADARQYIEEIS